MRASSQTPVSIRQAVAEDVDCLAAIEQGAFSDPWPAKAFLDLLHQAHAHVTVALTMEGDVCGYCVLLVGADEGEIANIAVTPECQRQGIAAQLLDHAIGAAQLLAVVAIFLEVRLSNEPARALYTSRGFAPVGRRRAYYREPLEDALVLKWGAEMA